MHKYLLVVLAFVATTWACNPVDFCVYVLEDYNCTNTYVEGRLAAGRDIRISNLTLGCQIYNPTPAKTSCVQFGSELCRDHPNDEPTIVTGRNAYVNSVKLVVGRFFYGKTISQTKLQMVCDCDYKQVDWSSYIIQAIANLKSYSAYFGGWCATGTTSQQGSTCNFASTSSGPVFSMQSSTAASCSTWNLNVPSTATGILFNIYGTNPVINACTLNAQFSSKKSKIIYNFPDATTLTLTNCNLIGLVLAPKAAIVSSGGSVLGQIYGKSYVAGKQATCGACKWNPYDGDFPTNVCPATSTSTQTTKALTSSTSAPKTTATSAPKTTATSAPTSAPKTSSVTSSSTPTSAPKTTSSSNPPATTKASTTSNPAPTTSSSTSSSNPPAPTTSTSNPPAPTTSSTTSSSNPPAPTTSSTTSSSNPPAPTTSSSTSNPPAPTTSSSTSNPPAPTTSSSTSNPPAPTTSSSTSNPPAPTTSSSTSNPPAPTTSSSTSNPPAPTTSSSTSNPPAPTTSSSTSNPAPTTSDAPVTSTSDVPTSDSTTSDVPTSVVPTSDSTTSDEPIPSSSSPNPPPNPPTPICGDSIVDDGEDCDGGICCSSNCTFIGNNFQCRPAIGECDMAEYCAGTSANCPDDTVSPAGTPCGSSFGICSVVLKDVCDGKSYSCNSAPSANVFYWDAFNVLSFDSYTCSDGDIEGRLAAMNNVELHNFDIGLKTTPSDPFSAYDLVVGGNAIWTSGACRSGDTTGEIVVGGNFTAPAYLQELRDSSVYISKLNFQQAQQYYVTMSQRIALMPVNAKVTVQYGGLKVTCNNINDTMIIFQVSAYDFNTTNWYSTENCRYSAAYIMTLTGPGDIEIKGGQFPGIVERLVYNSPQARSIVASTGVYANLLAPTSTYYQTTGVSYGKVIIGNVTLARQNNKPNCVDIVNSTISNVNLRQVNPGDSAVVVVSLSNYVVGDQICIDTECRVIKSGVVADVDGDGVKDNIILVTQPFNYAHPAGSRLMTIVTDAESPLRDASIPISDELPEGAIDGVKASSASTLVASAMLVAALSLL